MIRKTTLTLLFLATLTVLGTGIVSYWHGVPADTIWIHYVPDQPHAHVAMVDGILHVVYSRPWDQTSTDQEAHFGPFYARQTIVGGTEAVGVGAPFWALFPWLLIAPLISFLRGPVRRWRRRRRGQCTRCGYILTGLPESRCPECGLDFAPRRTRAAQA